MKKTVTILLSVFLIIAGILLWWFSDTQVLKRHTEALAKHFIITKTDAKSSRAIKNQNFAELLSKNFSGSLDLDEYTGQITFDEAVTGHQYFALSCESSQASVSDIEITSITDATATIEAVFKVSIIMPGGRTYNESSQASLAWKKTAKKLWKLETITLK